MRRATWFALVLLAIGVAAARTAQAAYDAFLEFDGIQGANQDARHPDEIGVLSFSWGMPHGGPTAAAVSRDATVAERELTITKVVDRASPLLARAQANKRRFSQVTLRTRAATYRLHDVEVTTFRIGSSPAGVATETITLAFTSVKRGPPTLAPPSHVGAAVLAPNPAGKQP